MDITSDHLDMIMPGSNFSGLNEGDDGEELSKRVETFGQPVGKRVFVSFNTLLYL